MKKIIAISILILFISTTYSFSQRKLARFEKNNAFTYGEKLRFRLYYNLYYLNIPVAEINVNVKPEPKMINNKPHYHLYLTGNSYGFYDNFFKVRDIYESMIDVKTFQPTAAIQVLNEGKYHSQSYYIFDHQKDIVKTSKGKKIKTGDFSQDALSLVYLARTINYSNAKKGDSFMFNMFIDDSCYYVGMKYMGKEIIKYKGDSYRCLKLQPILIVDRVFKSEDEMMLWVTDDENKIPLKIFSGISIGNVKVELYEFSGIKNKISCRL